MMPHPYQRLSYCSQPRHAEAGILVAASGSYLHTFNVQDGEFLSTWSSNKDMEPCRNTEKNARGMNDPSSLELPSRDSRERPQKRRKFSPARDDSGSSAEIVVDGGDEIASNSQVKRFSNPPFIHLAGTSNGQYVVAVTGEDKCIRVFTLSGNGTLTQLSERQVRFAISVILGSDEAQIDAQKTMCGGSDTR